MPATAEYPLAGLCFIDCTGNHRDHFVPVLGLGQVENLLRTTEAHEVAMPLDETGHREAAVEFDHLGLRTDIGRDLVVAANRGDPVAVNRDGFGIAERWIDRRNLAAAQYQVGRRHIGGCHSFRRILRTAAAGSQDQHQD